MRIAEVAEVVTKNLVKTRLFYAFSVKSTKQRVPAQAFAVEQKQRCAGPGNDASTEILVGFGAGTEVQSCTRMRSVPEIQESSLIVATSVGNVDGSKKGVFDLVFVAGGGNKVRDDVARLRGEARTVVLEVAVAGEVAKFGSRDGS